VPAPRFVPTHEIPAGGVSTWDRPDPARPPDHTLDADLPVQLLEQTTGWGRIRCHNGWETWVDAATLVPLELATFRPTFRAPPDGLDACATPDGEVVARVDPHLPLAVVAALGDWLKVRASNDWEAWVRAGTLDPIEEAD
jgi:SH3-like domain-containing protein